MEMSEAVRKQAALLSAVPIFSGFDDPNLGSMQFDVISMFDVVEHVYRPRPFLREVCSHLKPGGRLVLETPHTDCKSAEALGVNHEDVKPIEHALLYRTAHLEELLREAGCDPERVIYPDGEDQARILFVARNTDVPALVESA
jgi:SAM-dependent methyltransferase